MEQRKFRRPIPASVILGLLSAVLVLQVFKTFFSRSTATQILYPSKQVSTQAQADLSSPPPLSRTAPWNNLAIYPTKALTVFNHACPAKEKNVIQLRSIGNKKYTVFHRSILATIPRSGNHFIRFLIERTTKVQTETMMPESRTTTFSYRAMGYGSCPLDGDFGCEGSEIRRSEGGDSLLVKFHYPFHGPSPFWGESQSHIDSIVTTIRAPFENYMSWLFFKCKTKESPLYSFEHYMTEWVDFHLEYRIYSRKTCTPLLEVAYEEMIEEEVRRATMVDIAKRLNFTYAPEDAAEAARKYTLKVSPTALRLSLAPEELCFAFKEYHVEQDPATWPVFLPRDEPEWESRERAAMLKDYKLSQFHKEFQKDFRDICGTFKDGRLQLVRPTEPAIADSEWEMMKKEANSSERRDFMSCARITTVQNGRGDVKSAGSLRRTKPAVETA